MPFGFLVRVVRPNAVVGCIYSVSGARERLRPVLAGGAAKGQARSVGCVWAGLIPKPRHSISGSGQAPKSPARAANTMPIIFRPSRRCHMGPHAMWRIAYGYLGLARGWSVSEAVQEGERLGAPSVDVKGVCVR